METATAASLKDVPTVHAKKLVWPPAKLSAATRLATNIVETEAIVEPLGVFMKPAPENVGRIMEVGHEKFYKML